MTTRYKATARELLTKARSALQEGDLLQASEKGWGAAAQITKVVADTRGWPHNSHRYLFTAVAQLVDETADADLGRLFRSANALHQNFYEQWWPTELVSGALDDVSEYLSKLQPLLP